MDLDATLALATANGWSDDSQWTRSTIEHQISLAVDGWLATVKVLTNGDINWGVHDESRRTRTQRGVARTIEAGMTACRAAIAANLGTLY